MRFEDLQLHPKLLAAVHQEGYEKPTSIQAQAIPHVLAGRDLLGCAQTGTGKTAAFALPILHRLQGPEGREPRVLVLVPTRELATQVAESFSVYGKQTGLRTTVVFGGVSQVNQVRALRAGIDILVAAPGRLLDLMQQKLVSLAAVQVLVLDEADRMLDMGFIQPIRQIIAALPKQRQNLLFSATMPEAIRGLANSILKNPASVAVAPVASTVDQIEQSIYYVDQPNKMSLLLHLLDRPDISRAIVFARTKHGADRVTRKLEQASVAAAAIHGNKSQNARQRALANFKLGKTRVLVATDVAARGIDVDGVSHVINYDLPNEAESYVHRIGRTGRAGATGIALSFCDRTERGYLRDIERLIKKAIPVVGDHPYIKSAPVSQEQEQRGPQRPRGREEGSRRPARSHSHAPRPERSSDPAKRNDQRAGAARPSGGSSRRSHRTHPAHSR